MYSNPINGLEIDSTASIYQIFDRPEGQVLVCDICAQEFTEPKQIKQHKREAHRFQCDQCAHNYTGNEHYFIHGMYNEGSHETDYFFKGPNPPGLSFFKKTHYLLAGKGSGVD